MKLLGKIKFLVLWVWRHRPFWLRALLCWAIGLAFLWNDYNSNYDYRFKVRGSIKKETDITLIMISDNEWKKLKNQETDFLQSLGHIYINETLTDNFYWDEKVWTDILKKLINFKPRSIAVTFYFGKNLGDISIDEESKKIFRSPKILWPARINQEGQFQAPLFSRTRDTGFINLYPDYDGIVRSFNTSLSSFPHYSYAVAQTKKSIEEYKKTYFINYQTQPNKMKSYRLTDLLSGNIPTKDLTNKIVIIGARDSYDHLHPTPLGFMNKTEIVGQIIQNFLDDSFPFKLPIDYYALYLLFLLIISLLIVFEYPQNYALALVIGLGGVISGVSAWVFDAYYFWTPILAGIIQMTSTYIIFIGYKLSQNERKTWKLVQEKQYLAELEQLKNNFISLISHDLKTPLAKIQAVTSRLLQNNPQISKDLDSIKNYSQDLYRYIQSILQVTRVESSDFKLKKEASDINQIVEKVIEQLRPLAHEKNIDLKVELEPLFSAEFDTALIHEVIANLVENGIKYTPAHGTVTVSTKEIDNKIILEVADTGDGIEASELDNVWEKFYRGKKHNLSTQGTGLGLYLVKYFVELHNGTVFLQSDQKHGTRIGFKLPI